MSHKHTKYSGVGIFHPSTFHPTSISLPISKLALIGAYINRHTGQLDTTDTTIAIDEDAKNRRVESKKF